jgi:prepilin-type processing-associated H-X9-DG protein
VKEITKRKSDPSAIEDLEPQADPKGGEGSECLVFYLGGVPSSHPGGVNVVLADGSVRTTPEPSVAKTGK